MTPASCVHDPSPTLLWLREDLRTSDHEALMAACADGGPVVALWIREECAPGPGGVVTWWAHAHQVLPCAGGPTAAWRR